MANSRSGDGAVDRIVRVLATFSNERTSQTPTEIGRHADLPDSTAHRMVADLVRAGILERDEENRVRLGMRLWEVAMRGSRALRLRQAALPFMEEVQAAVGQHTQLAVIEQESTLFLERLSAPGASPNLAQVAGRLPLHASSAGLVLLAYAPPELQQRVLAGPLPPTSEHTITDAAALRRTLAEIRQVGWIVAHGFVDPDATAVAVPIRQRAKAVAALAVVIPRGSVSDQFVLAQLRTAAVGVRRVLGPTPV